MNHAWLAGFFDGEGHVGVLFRKPGQSPSVRLAVAQRDPEALLLIQAAFPTPSLWRNPSGAYVLWYTRQATIVALVDAMLPHAVVKPEALTLVREFCHTKDLARRLEIAHRLRELSKRHPRVGANRPEH